MLFIFNQVPEEFDEEQKLEFFQLVRQSTPASADIHGLFLHNLGPGASIADPRIKDFRADLLIHISHRVPRHYVQKAELDFDFKAMNDLSRSISEMKRQMEEDRAWNKQRDDLHTQIAFWQEQAQSARNQQHANPAALSPWEQLAMGLMHTIPFAIAAIRK